MKVQKIQKIFNITLLILWMIIVFLFSNESANDSSNTSENFIANVFEILNIENVKITDNVQFIFRKLAHFTLYFIGGLLSYNVFKDYFKKNTIISIVVIVIYSVVDEIHQHFIPGRTMKILDVFIDSFGAICGVVFCYFIFKLINKFIKNREKVKIKN